MIRLVEGGPGSGKSYYACKYLIKYCTYDKLYQEYILSANVLVISNIEGLRIKHRDLNVCIEKAGGVENFFTVENFEKLQSMFKVSNIILVIDEAQKIFDSKFYDKEVFFFFQYHRHLGVDIFLLTQSRSTVSRQLLPLCEYFLQAVPRSKGIYGTFRYKVVDAKGNYLYGVSVKQDQQVFRAYKSFSSDEIEKPKNVLLRYAVMFVVVGLITYGLFKSVFTWFKVRSSPPSAIAQTIPQQQQQMPKPVQARYSTPVVNIGSPTGYVQPVLDTLIAQQATKKPEWVSVTVDGYIEADKTYLITALGVRQKVFKNLDLQAMTVEIPLAAYNRAATSSAGGRPSGGGPAALLSGQGSFAAADKIDPSKL